MKKMLILAASLIWAMAAMPVHASKPTIITFGDSVTWGDNATRDSLPPYNASLVLADHVNGKHDTSYPADLTRMLGEEAYNFGYAGEDVRTGVKRLTSIVQQDAPNVVIVLEGLNDLAGAHPLTPKQMVESYKQMNTVVTGAGGVLVMCTLTPSYYPRGDSHHVVNGRIKAVNAAIRKWAYRDKIPIVQVWAAITDHGGDRLMVRANGVPSYAHPDDKGYKILARTVSNRIDAGL